MANALGLRIRRWKDRLSSRCVMPPCESYIVAAARFIGVTRNEILYDRTKHTLFQNLGITRKSTNTKLSR